MKLAAAIMLGLGLIVLAYSNHFDNTFHFDDSHTIENNLYIRSLSNIPAFFKSGVPASSLPPNQGYRPIVTTSLAIDYWLGGGLEPWAFHTSMFVIYLIQLFLMFFLYRLIVGRYSVGSKDWFAFFAVLFYGIHTANAETINYIISRSDSYSTFFVVAALLLYISHLDSKKRHLSLVPVTLAMLTKEAGVVLPALLFAFNIIIERRPLRRSILESIPSGIICVIFLALSYLLAPHWSAGGGGWWTYVSTQTFIVTHYLGTYFLPIHLSADSDFAVIANPFDARIVLSSLLLLILTFAAYKAALSKNYRPCAFGFAWFLFALAPTSLLPLAEVQNDHRTFFPYIGLNLAIWWAMYAWLAPRFAQKEWRNSLAILFSLLVSAHAYGVYQRNIVWHSEESLWLDVTKKSPTNGRGLMNYGLTQMSKGNLAEAKNYFERALQFAPFYAYLHVNLGIVNGALGNKFAAEAAFHQAMRLRPDIPESYSYYARWLNDQKRSAEAETLLSTAVRLSPGDLFAQQELERTRELLRKPE